MFVRKKDGEISRLELPDLLKYDTKETDFNPSFLLFVLLILLFSIRLIRKRKTTAAKVRTNFVSAERTSKH
jgi:hypothetical protein